MMTKGERYKEPVALARTVLSEPFGAACMPGGVSPCGLEAGAPPIKVLV
jgi:hypothetical protein